MLQKHVRPDMYDSRMLCMPGAPGHPVSKMASHYAPTAFDATLATSPCNFSGSCTFKHHCSAVPTTSYCSTW